MCYVFLCFILGKLIDVSCFMSFLCFIPNSGQTDRRLMFYVFLCVIPNTGQTDSMALAQPIPAAPEAFRWRHAAGKIKTEGKPYTGLFVHNTSARRPRTLSPIQSTRARGNPGAE